MSWNYGTVETPFPYGQDATYQKAIAFLDGPGVLEDWGCGTTFAKRYVRHAKYRGIDFTPSAFNDVTADLRSYHSEADYILLRHVLEHNLEWEKILQAAVDSAKYRLCVVLFTPLAEKTTQLAWNEQLQVADYSLEREAFWRTVFKRRLVCAEDYGNERLIYLA